MMDCEKDQNLTKAIRERHGARPTEIDAMRAAAEKGLTDKIRFLGFIDNREGVLEKYRAADVFRFCNLTPESPRCLIEALVSGTPIIGYEGAFARDLISQYHGGLLVGLGDIDALVARLKDVALDRATLAELIKAAAQDGAPYDDVSVFAHRSDVIKEHLGPIR